MKIWVWTKQLTINILWKHILTLQHTVYRMFFKGYNLNAILMESDARSFFSDFFACFFFFFFFINSFAILIFYCSPLVIYDWQWGRGYRIKCTKNGLSSPNPKELFNWHPIWQGKITAIRVQSFQLHFSQSFSPGDYTEHSSKEDKNRLKDGLITGPNFWKYNYFLIIVRRAILHSLTLQAWFGQRCTFCIKEIRKNSQLDLTDAQ